MCRIGLILFLALLALHVSTVFCNPWWSIVSGNGVFNQENPTIPIHVGCDFDLILNNEQRNLCRAYGDKMLSTIAIGVLQALNQCQKMFRDSPWNCSVFADSKSHYLGRFAEIGTRETAFLNAIISAGIAREIARKCKEQELSSCNCDFSVKGSTSGDSRNISGCGDNSAFGAYVTAQFTNATVVNDDAITLAEVHNNAVGRSIVTNEASVHCVCHGVSGSCSVRTCFKKVPDIDELGQQLYRMYFVAKHVKEANEKLIPVEPSVPALTNDELAYLEFSPNFCKRNLTYGIYGTSGRQCYPDRTDQTSCSSLCCGGPTIQKTETKMEEESECCKFVWCCYLDCTSCSKYTVTQYYCQ